MRFVLLMLLFVACGSSTPQPEAKPVGSEAGGGLPDAAAEPTQSRFLRELEQPPEDTWIALRRTACYGTCPMFAVEVDREGHVAFDGIDHVAKRGPRTRKIDPKIVLDLLHAAGEVRFFDITQAELTDCDHVMTDAPSAIVSITANGTFHRLEDYRGCIDPGREDLRAFIERVSDTLTIPEWLAPEE